MAVYIYHWASNLITSFSHQLRLFTMFDGYTEICTKTTLVSAREGVRQNDASHVVGIDRHTDLTFSRRVIVASEVQWKSADIATFTNLWEFEPKKKLKLKF